MQLEAGTGLLQALAAAGGLTELAHRDRIFVLRQGNSTTRIRFTFEAVSHAEGRSAAFRLRDGDVIVVE
jgi:polysaccharide export outer membrane protein